VRRETQRELRTRAVARTTPCLLGVFSLVVLLAHTLHPQNLPARRAGLVGHLGCLSPIVDADR
jgi:hypothetical protein